MNNFLKNLTLFATIPIIFCVAFFCYHFFGTTISKDISAWAQFGDFFGGVLNPYLGILNLILLGYLTLSVKKAEENRAAESLRMSFMPVGVIFAYDYEDCTHVTLVNCGTGPLFLTNVIATQNGATTTSLVDQMPDLPSDLNWTNFLISTKDIAIPAGQSIDLIKIDYEDHPIHDETKNRIRQALFQTKLEVHYAGISNKFPDVAKKSFENFGRHFE
jgi:hypothetical protein